jgi:hypothetical protein
MATPRKQKTKNLNGKGNPVTNVKQISKVADNLANDPDTSVAAIGTALQTSVGKLGDSITDNDNAHDAAQLANTKMYEQNSTTASDYNNAGVKIMQKFENNPNKWKSYGFVLTKDAAEARPIPGMPINGSMLQGKFPATCSIRFDVVPNADSYSIEMTKGDLSEASVFVQVKSPRMFYTTTNITFDVPKEYLNVLLWVKVTAHNTTGDSPASEPFGCMKIQ